MYFKRFSCIAVLIIYGITLTAKGKEFPAASDSLQALIATATTGKEKFQHYLELARLGVDFNPAKVAAYTDSATKYAASPLPEIYIIQASALINLDQNEKALPIAMEAHRLAERNKDEEGKAHAQYLLARISSDTIASIKQLRELIHYYRQQRNYEMRGNIYYALGLKHVTIDIDSAISFFHRAITHYQLSDYITAVGKCKWQLGNCYRMQNKYYFAYKSWLQALQLFQQQESWYNLSISNFSMAQHLESVHDTSGSIRYYTGAYESAEQSGDSTFKATIITKIGNGQLTLNQTEKAIMSFNHSREIARKINDSSVIAASYLGLIQAYNQLSFRDTAAMYADSARILFNNFQDSLQLRLFLMQSLLSNSHKLNQEEILEAYMLYSDTISGMQMVRNVLMFAELYFRGQNYHFDKKIAGSFIKALHISITSGMKYEESLLRKYLFNYYRQIGKYEIALDHYEGSARIADSIQLDRYRQRIAAVSVGYEMDRYNLQSALNALKDQQASNRLRSKRKARMMMLGGMVIMIIIGFMIYRRNKRVKKNNIS